MSSSSSSSPPQENYTGKWEYDVFVCFRGRDTRRLFTSHLAGHLRQRSIQSFTDQILDRAENIEVALLELLRRSALSVVIFSEGFAESSYCLDEVATIAESVERFGHRVLPVFYGVDPEEVSGDGHGGGYRDVIKAELKPSVEKKKRWMDGLKQVCQLAGRTSKEFKDDYEMCKAIVDDVLKALSDMSSKRKPNSLVGMETRVSEVCRLLRTDGTLNIIGLWGMGGVGKTTLARNLYQRLTPPSRYGINHHFVSNINDNNGKTRGGVDELVQQLYSALLSENNNLSLQDLDLNHRRERLSRLRVVVVLDNVETPRQLEQLLLGEILDPTKLFGPWSTIIITSRNMRVLQHVKARIYHVEDMNPDESHQVFNLHAFRQLSSPSDDLKGHSHLAVSYCKGNPLALKVLGGALFGKAKEYWKSFFSGLERNSKPEIHDVLSTSYYALKGEEQRLFMDVACFQFNTPKARLIEYLATSYESGYSMIEDLIDKSLMFTIASNDVTHYEVVVVHDLLKEMAWNIVKEESLPSRLKNPSDVHTLFAIRKTKKRSWTCSKAKYVHSKDAFGGGKAIQSLALNLSKTKKKELCLGAKAFEGMDSLRLLAFYGHKAAELVGVPEIRLVNGRLDTLPIGLRWLEWTGYHLKCLPQKFYPENLVTLSLRHSRVERCWPKGVKPKLVHLITLDLSYSTNLKIVPNLSGSKNLELLRLTGCKRLVEIPSHVQYLDKLVELDLCECSNLVRVPAILNSKRLKYVRLARCPRLDQCLQINSSEVVLEVLDLVETPIGVHKFYRQCYRGKCAIALKHLYRSHTTMRTKNSYNYDSGNSSPSSLVSYIMSPRSPVSYFS